MLLLVARTAISAVVGGRSGKLGMHPKVIMMTSSPPLVVRGRVSTQDLVQIVIFERFPLKDKVGKTSTDLAKNAPTPRRVAYSSSILGGQVRLHGLNKANRLGVRRHRQGALDDIVPKRIHHQLAEAVRIVQLVEVLLADAVSAALEAFFHHVRTELLNG